MANDGGGPESEQRPSLLKSLLNKLNTTPTETPYPRSRFDSDSAAIVATPESDMTHGLIRKTVQPSQRDQVAVPEGVEDRLQQIGSETFGYTPQQLELARKNNYDLSSVKGKAGFASFLGKYYSPKTEPTSQANGEAHRVAQPNNKLEFPMVDNTGPMK